MKLLSFYSQFQSYSINIQRILIWNMIFCLALGIHLVLYNLYLQSIVHDEAIIGRILGFNFLAQAIIYIPAGLFSDHVGSKKGVIAGVVIFKMALIGNLFAFTPGELSFWGFMIGLGHAASIVTFVPLLTDYSNSSEKKDLFTFAFSTGTFFTFLGTLLGGIVSDRLQKILHLSETPSFRMTLSITIILLILCMIPLFSVKKTKAQTSATEVSSLFSLMKSNPEVLLPIIKFSFSKALAGASLGIIIPFMNLFFLHKFALSASYISFILAAATLVTVIFMTYNSKITNRISEVKTVSLYHLISIPAVLFLGLTENIWIAIIAFVIFRSAKFGLTPIESKIMMEQVVPEVRGLTNSFGFMTNSLCISMLGPFAMYLVQVVGTERGYLFLCIISSFGSLIAAIYFLLAFGQRKVHGSNIFVNTSA